jgi:uncharacterized membrane protein
MTKKVQARWSGDFFAGLAIVLPAVVSIAVLVWLFGAVANVTNTLLLVLPHALTHDLNDPGRVRWYWSLVSIVATLVLIGCVGRLARHYLGKKVIELVDDLLLRVPLLNKIYGTVKQVNESFSPSNKSSFKQVVLLEYPRAGLYSVGFVTGEAHAAVATIPGEKLLNVFIPTTPNPTSGFLVLVPESAVTKLDLSVADGIKFTISLGSIAPEKGAMHPLANATAPL